MGRDKRKRRDGVHPVWVMRIGATGELSIEAVGDADGGAEGGAGLDTSGDVGFEGALLVKVQGGRSPAGEVVVG